MNTLNRPLFRQMGGPAEPMPQDMPMAMPPPQEAIMAVQQSENMGTQMGQEYLAQTMGALDNAETSKEVIDAIRGNNLPIEARYDELANFVGQEDAQQTPESVLALVQPTIMMTEEGAMNSGIGQLMQSLVADTDMAPNTDMTGGVGSLMMAGASEAPAPQNFNQGGAVAYLQKGSDDSGTVPAGIASINAVMETFGNLAKPPSVDTVKGYYESLLPMYREILGQSEEDKRMRRGETFFDIAQAGLNLAAGIDPRTGRSTAGMPFVSQLAAAASPLPGQISARAAEQRAEDRVLNATALQTAMQQAQDAQSFRQTIGATLAKDILDPTKFESDAGLVIKDGKVEAFNIDTPDGFTDYQTALKQGAVPYEKPTAESGKANLRVVTDLTKNSRQFVDINTPEGRKVVEDASAANAASADGDLFAVNTIATDPGSKSAQAFLVDGLTYLSYDGGRTYEDADGNRKAMPTGAAPLSDTKTFETLSTLSKRTNATVKLRELMGIPTDADSETFDTSVITQNAKGGSRDKDGKVTAVALTSQEQADLDALLASTSEDAIQAALQGTGPYAAISAAFDSALGGFGVPFTSDPETQAFRQTLRGIRVLGRSALVVNPRFPVAEMQNVGELFPEPDAFFRNPDSEAQKLIELKRLAKGQLIRNYAEIESGISTDLIPDIEANNRELNRLLALLQAVPDTYGTAANRDNVIQSLQNTLRTNR